MSASPGTLKPALRAVLAVLSSACAAGTGTTCAPTDSRPAAPGDLSDVPVVPERWVTGGDARGNLDSPAYWAGAGHHWVIVTAKATDELRVFEASTGALVGSIGRTGSGPGELRRPNGIAVIDDLLLVVERDNRRVQAFLLPSFEPLGTFGQGELIRPYGIAFHPRDNAVELYVTDDYGLGEPYPEGLIPLTRRVQQYRLERERNAPGSASGDGERPQLSAAWVRSFGEASGPGALHVVESIQVDPDHDLLLIADESRFELEVYDVEGRYTGRTIARDVYGFGDPEGIMLYRCGPDSGYWILTDQGESRSVFHVLDRTTFTHVGSFAGRRTANTDGIWLEQGPVPGLGEGALFAVHDDRGLSAFSWGDIARTLDLRSDCRARSAAPSDSGTPRPRGEGPAH